MTDIIIPEQNTEHAKSMNLNILNEVAKSVCKVYVSGEEKTVPSKGKTGFFFNTFKNIGVKMTVNMLVIFISPEEKESFHIGKEIKIISNDGNLKETLSLNNQQHKIILLTNMDFCVIQFLDVNDQILKKFNFLDIDFNCKNSDYGKYLKKDVFILHYPSSDDLECSSGKIMEVNSEKDEFSHTLDSNKGSLGSPTLLLPESNENSKPKVIGVYTSYIEDREKNKGIFINKLVNLGLRINNQQTDSFGRSKKSRIHIFK